MPDEPFSDEFFDRWEHLISQVEISNVPIRFMKEISVTFVNGDQTIFDVAHMITSGQKLDVIETTLEDFLEQYDDVIESVDFHINLIALAEEVDAKTAKLLNK